MRRLFRALLLTLKGKLESARDGILSFEDEFLAYTVMEDGQTVGQWASPQINLMYEKGEMPPLLGVG
jgi:hypothetical protein